MTHRQPTRHDIGREVEVSDDETVWTSLPLLAIYGNKVIADAGSVPLFFQFCRIPITTADPLAELSAWADRASEAGADEVARVLLDRIACMQQPYALQSFATPTEPGA
jgi:hypothetical protein